MPRIRVSRYTHERIARHAISHLDMATTEFHPDDTVSFWVQQRTYDRLIDLSHDVEAAINKALDFAEARDTRN
jgi:hypothetical protein